MRMFPTKDKGNKTTAAVDLRDALRGEATKVSKMVDQVVMATVREVSERDGETTVAVLIDGFRAGNIFVGWGYPTPPEVGMRVSMVGLMGGQEWYVCGVLADQTIPEMQKEIETLQTEMNAAQLDITRLRNSLSALTRRFAALESG